MPSRLIRASEIGAFVFCARAWWLQRVVGLEPGNAEQRAAGDAYHAGHGRRVWASTWLQRAALGLVAAAALLAVWAWLSR